MPTEGPPSMTSTERGPHGIQFTAAARRLWINGSELHLKGTSWFGLETADACFHGLWANPLTFYLDFLHTHSFNAIRVPFSLELALQDRAPQTIDYSKNEYLLDKSSLQVLDIMVAESARRGLLIMLDLHHLQAGKGIPPLWHDAVYTEADVLRGLQHIAQRYAKHWNVFAMDIKNEPHGNARWHSENPNNDWGAAAQRLGNAVLQVAPHLLIFVEGVEHGSHPVAEQTFWGGHFGDLAKLPPLQLSIPQRLVYSPHVYGPSVHMQACFNDPSFPANLPAIWHRQWAFLAPTQRASGTGQGALQGPVEGPEDGPAVVLGEWGGRAYENSLDRTWHEALAAYLKQNGLDVGFYWCLNPNSGDTGGLLQDDWTTPDLYKLQLLSSVTAHPTRVQHPASLQPQCAA